MRLPEAATAPAISPEVVQSRIDRSAHFNLLSVPVATGRSAALREGGRIVGVRVEETLHRFRVRTAVDRGSPPLRASNRVGEPVGRFSHRWMVAPDEHVAIPGRTPPATGFDPSRSQRLVLLDGRCTFGADDGFRGFGTGRTLPLGSGGGATCLVTAIGTVLEGSGRFAGHEQGTYVYCGTLDPERGFTGNLLLRVLDLQETLRTERSLPGIRPIPDPEEGVTYLVLRGEAVPSDPVSPNLGPDGRPIGLIVEQGLRLQFLDCAVRDGSGRRSGVRTSDRIGRLVGRITARVTFDPESADGTALDPIPFVADDEMVLTAPDGTALGRFTGDSTEGRVFNLELAGRPAIRFGGTGRLRGGPGPFRGLEGLLTDNSLVVFEPHVSASVYVLRVPDPDGRFRDAL